VCFIFGILWPRLNGQGAISSLLVGFVSRHRCASSFEVLDRTRHYDSGAIRWLVDMNFLHYAILMFVVCTFVADRRQPDVSGARAEKDRGTDVCDGGRETRDYGREYGRISSEKTPTERLFNLAFTGV